MMNVLGVFKGGECNDIEMQMHTNAITTETSYSIMNNTVDWSGFICHVYTLLS